MTHRAALFGKAGEDADSVPLVDGVIGDAPPLAVIFVVLSAAIYAISAVLCAATFMPGIDGLLASFWRPFLASLFDLGAAGAPALSRLHVWTTLSAPWLHTDLMHLLVDCAVFLLVVPALEGVAGRRFTCLAFLAAGAFGMLAGSLAGEPIIVGASPGLFGLIAILIALTFGQRDPYSLELQGIALLGAAILVTLYFWSTPGVVPAADAGGFAGGLLAFALRNRLTSSGATPRTLALLVAGAGLSLVMGVIGGGAGAIQARFDAQTYFIDRADWLASVYERQIERAPDDIGLRLLRANFLLVKSDPAKAVEAISDLDRVFEAGFDSPNMRNQRAWALYLVGRPHEGLADIEKALAILPDVPAFLDTRGHLLAATGHREQAIADYRRALRIDPSLTETRDALEKLEGHEL